MDDKTVRAIQDIATAAAGPRDVSGGNVPYVLVPAGYAAKAMPELIYNEHNAAPERVKASVVVSDKDSFISYFAKFMEKNSMIFADDVGYKITGVVDYHNSSDGAPTETSPKWCDHRVTLAFRYSQEWSAWVGKNNAKFSQSEFAEFLEQHASDIANPSPATMMEVASDLHMKSDVEFVSGIRQTDGQIKLQYTETAKTSVGKGQIEAPDRFTLSIAPFVGSDRINVEALLRFRVNQGKLIFWYTLVRPDTYVREAFLGVRETIGSGLGVRIVNGWM